MTPVKEFNLGICLKTSELVKLYTFTALHVLSNLPHCFPGEMVLEYVIDDSGTSYKNSILEFELETKKFQQCTLHLVITGIREYKHAVWFSLFLYLSIESVSGLCLCLKACNLQYLSHSLQDISILIPSIVCESILLKFFHTLIDLYDNGCF
jgi:hypothetical protein